jgi:hypothetical protein
MTAAAVFETELTGSGAATVLRSDYDLNMPSVVGVLACPKKPGWKSISSP